MANIKKLKILIKPEFNKSPEVTANRYAIRCNTITQIIMFIIWILNLLNIFTINFKTTTITLILTLIIYVTGAIICLNADLSKAWVKYFIITWTILLITCLTTALTYHATIASVLPIIYTTMYSSKRIKWYTIFAVIISTMITVYGGYYFGICDANMVLLTGEPLAEYISAGNNFTLTAMNNNLPRTLTLYFVFPRSILYTVIAFVCANISKIITHNTNYATEMRHLAERDQMTGAYTKSKYLDMINNDYKKEEHIGIIYWDINFLKKTNDTYGHEYGDKLIHAIADSIRQFNNDNDKTYRIGGDEFVMVMRGANEKSVTEKINKWNAYIKKADPIGDIPLSASYGYAWGEGKNIDQIIHNADQMMYTNKRQHHEANNS